MGPPSRGVLSPLDRAFFIGYAEGFVDKDERMEVRVAADELDLYRRAADAADLSLSAYVRGVLRVESLAVLAAAGADGEADDE